MMVEPTQGGSLLAVKVVAGASRDRIVGPWGGASQGGGGGRSEPAGRGERLKVTVCQPAHKGAANKAVCVLLASRLEVRPSDVTVLRGATRPEKILFIRSLSAEEVLRRLGLS